MHKEAQFKRKILADLSELESVERHWLASILAGIIVGAIDLGLFLQFLGDMLKGRPLIFPAISFFVVVAINAILLAMSLWAFAEYFNLELRVNVGRGMVIKKRRGRTWDEEHGQD